MHFRQEFLCLLQSLLYSEIASEYKFFPGVVSIIQINPLSATRWKNGHAHFLRFGLVFVTKSSEIFILIESYHIF